MTVVAWRRVRPQAFTAFVVFWLFACAPDEREPMGPPDQPSTFLAAGGQQPDLDSALAVHRRHTIRLMAIPGVVGTGVGLTADGRPAITIFTKQSGVTGLPDALEGIPVQVKVTGEVVTQPAQAPTCADYVNCTSTSAWPTPVPIGVSSGGNALLQGLCRNTGTLGARVIRWEIGGTRIYALSNNHVFALENTVPVGGNVLQPGRFDTPNCSGTGSTVIGTLSAFAPIAFGGADNVIDAAIASTDATLVDNWTGPGGYGVPNSVTRAATLGMSVQKYGRTTGLTTGQVTEIDATFNIPYTTGVARFVHQIVISNCPGNNCSRGGDSGSLWVTNDAGKNPVGLHFAGTQDFRFAFANPIDSVLSFFGVVNVDDGPAPSASGGLTAWCEFECWPGAFITAVTASGGNTITVRDNSGHSAMISLASATASGGLSAFCEFDWPFIASVTASGSNTITVRDNCGHTGTITLSGANAIGGLTPFCNAEPCGWPYIRGITASGTRWITVEDGYAGNKGYLRLSF